MFSVLLYHQSKENIRDEWGDTLEWLTITAKENVTIIVLHHLNVTKWYKNNISHGFIDKHSKYKAKATNLWKFNLKINKNLFLVSSLISPKWSVLKLCKFAYPL